ncbi:MAG: amidase family protein [Dethiobacteria bacterium]|jgi:aspartyl-tRNA(Asn)/glutamyl-tRNA(Gln) amidotransferase subunit A|nr:hypothetical protein [Bacillota bacterium]
MAYEHLEELGKVVVERCRNIDKESGVFVSFDADLIAEDMKLFEEKLEQGEELPLAGLSFVLADNISTAGIRTTCGSKMLASYQPLFDAEAVSRLKDNGALLAGKTTVDEFGFGVSSVKSGAAKAVSAGAVNFALSVDTVGELRQAASIHGIAAIKPTYGRIPRKGVVGYAASLEVLGIMAKKVTELAVILKYIAGHLPADPTSLIGEVPDYPSLLEEGPAEFKIAVPADWSEARGIDEPTKKIFGTQLKLLDEYGFRIELVPFSYFYHSFLVAQFISAVEAFSDLANYDGVRFGYRDGAKHLQEMFINSRSKGMSNRLKRFLVFGALVSSKKYFNRCYLQAQKMRTLIKEELKTRLKKYDFIFTPTVPFTNAKTHDAYHDSLLNPASYYTAAANLAGLPALTIPIAHSEVHMPGLHFIGSDETGLLQAALRLEKEYL